MHSRMLCLHSRMLCLQTNDNEDASGRSQPVAETPDVQPSEYTAEAATTSNSMEATSGEEVETVESTFAPFHADASQIPCQQLTKKTLYFQDHWFKQFPWLHFSTAKCCILCFYCSNVCTDRSLPWVGNAEPAFTSAGFNNWKKALNSFRQHKASHSYFLAMQHWSAQTKPISVQLSSQCQQEQQTAAKCLEVIGSYVRYLAHEGLALRGHSTDTGHLQELLKLRAADVPELQSWLERHNSYTSGNILNELLLLMSQAVQRKLAAEIASTDPLQFSVIIDGARDISGVEQESICVRYVSKDLVPREIFIGMYAAAETTGEALPKLLSDVLLRLNLPLSALHRGQTYDGASSMAGQYKGCQALVHQKNPLAVYVHCGAHCVHLVMESVAVSSPHIRDPVQWVHELGTLTSQSGKFKSMFAVNAADMYQTYRNLHVQRPDALRDGSTQSTGSVLVSLLLLPVFNTVNI